MAAEGSNRCKRKGGVKIVCVMDAGSICTVWLCTIIVNETSRASKVEYKASEIEKREILITVEGEYDPSRLLFSSVSGLLVDGGRTTLPLLVRVK